MATVTRDGYATADAPPLGGDAYPASPAGRTAESRGLADLLKDLRDETTGLIRQEVALAKSEMSRKAATVGRNAGYLGAGAAIAHAGAILLLMSLAALCSVGLGAVGVDAGIAIWLGPLIVGLIAAAIGYGLIQKALATLRHETLVPEQTLDSLKENGQWLQQKTTTA